MMNKKEQAEMDNLKMMLALRFTEPVEFDLMPPQPFSKELAKGWSINTYTGQAYKSCSSSIYHGKDWERTSSQEPIKQYSTEALALKALRHQLELDFASQLHKIDLKIQASLEGKEEIIK